ncbi:MAG TPA: hypothetical protein DCS19_07175 [Flavobacterium sp.]|nr:hypothetical protein [Flavobacterium sp.]
MDKLLVAVLGHRNSGKTTTWASLFERTVKTGKYLRRLYLNDKEYVTVFLISGSPEEREKDVEELITVENPTIVLCSTQYRADVIETYDYFKSNGYSIFVHWLNPGYSDQSLPYFDSLGLVSRLLGDGATLTLRNGKESPELRVQKMKEYIYGWAKYRDLIVSD